MDSTLNANANGNANLIPFLLLHYNSSVSSDAQLYAMFHASGPTPVLIVPAICLAMIGLIGIPLNAGIVYTTIKHRKMLNRNTNYLIAMNAFFDMLQLSHPFPFLLIALSGTNFISAFLSFRLILLSIFGIQCSLTCITCTGIDRLLSVLFPIRYHKMTRAERYTYCAVHTIVCVANGIWNDAGLWMKCEAEAEKPVTGFIGQIGWDSTKDFLHYLVGPILIGITIVSYIAIGIVMFIKKRKLGWGGSPASSTGLSQQQKLLKSLTVIVGVHVGTSMFGSILLGFSFIKESTLLNWYMMTLSLCIILLGACSNAIVLYLNSSEYRQLFNNGMSELKSVGLRVIGVSQPHPAFTQVGQSPTNPTGAVQSSSNRTTTF